MGNWTINIEGVGPHGDPEVEYNAEAIAAVAVEELRNNGHTVTHATVTSGGAIDVKDLAN